MRPSRKFSQPKPIDESANDELKDKQAMRAQRLQALAEEIDPIEWEKKKASKISDDKYVAASFFFFSEL